MHKKLQNGLLVQARTFSDPWGLGFTVRIRRAGHSKAVANTLQESKSSLALSMAYADAKDRWEAQGKELPKDIGRLALADPEFAAVLGETMGRTKEFEVCSYVAGWGNEDAADPFFEPHQLPKDGAFTRRDVLDKFLATFGTDDDDEVFVLPPFMAADKSQFIDDPELTRQASEIVMRFLDDMTKAMSKEIAEGKKDDAESDVDNGAAAKKRERLTEDLSAARDRDLLDLGVIRTPYGGQDLRTAVLSWIDEEAKKLQTEHGRGKRFLPPASN